MSTSKTFDRHAWCITSDYSPPKTAKVKLLKETISLPLDPTSVLVKVHAVSLNYGDATNANGDNPWPVLTHGIIGNDACGEVVDVGDEVKAFKIGDPVAPVPDSKHTTCQQAQQSWVAAGDDDVIMADYIVFNEEVLVNLPTHLDWVSASVIPSVGTTAWAAVKDVGPGHVVLIQGTSAVAIFALKLARAAGATVILTSSCKKTRALMRRRYRDPPIYTVDYTKPNWHKAVMRLTSGFGVDFVVETGGVCTLVNSMKCTRRGGVVSQVGYRGKQDPIFLQDLITTVIDRMITLRGINAGTKQDMKDLCKVLSTDQTQLRDIIKKTFLFSEANEVLQYVWEERRVGKVVLRVTAP